jgi:diguanylate cyclase (GGDEF)-like protein
MVTGVALACAVVLLCAVLLLGLRRLRVRADQRLEAALAQIDTHLEAVSASVSQALERLSGARATGAAFLTLDLDRLLETVVVEAAARTGAEAVVLRVGGPGDRPFVASFGPAVGHEQLERSFGPPDGGPFRTSSTQWTYRVSDDTAETRFHSSLVAPLEQAVALPGALALYSREVGAFTEAHASAVSALLDEAATGLANAKRFAEVEARTLLDPATGVPSPRGYEVELGREVARAQRSGRPLSVVVVGLAGPDAARSPGRRGNGVAEVGRLLARVTRKSDVSCRRGESEFAILLPGTTAAGATTLTKRLHDEAGRALGTGRSTLTVGYVEWTPDESTEALDARAGAALGRPVALVPHRLVKAEPANGATADLRRDALETLSREVASAHRLERSLALVVLDVDRLAEIAEQLGRESADAALDEVAGRLDVSVGAGSVHRLGPDEFALVLPSSTANDAEALLGAVQASLTPPASVERLTLSAGITELGEGEGAPAALERAEHALWQAKQVGHGTVVVAVTGPASPGSH